MLKIVRKFFVNPQKETDAAMARNDPIKPPFCSQETEPGFNGSFISRFEQIIMVDVIKGIVRP